MDLVITIEELLINTKYLSGWLLIVRRWNAPE